MDLTHKYETAEQRKDRLLNVATMHELLGIAIEDFETTLLMPDRYEINMHEWHVPAFEHGYGVQDQDKCVVCLAGSVLAQTYQMPLHINYCEQEGHDFASGRVRQLMSALSSLRHGNVSSAIISFYGRLSHNHYFDMPVYVASGDDADAFVAGLKRLQAHLKERNL